MVEVVDRVGLGEPQGPVTGLVEAVLKAEGVAGAVVVAFVDEVAIAGLNARFRGLEEATDVLSFRYADDDAGWPEQPCAGLEATTDSCRSGHAADLGEVIVCPAVVQRYAQEEGAAPGRRLAWTILHGVLHLVGYDHEGDNGEMRDREQALLGELDQFVRAVSSPEDH